MILIALTGYSNVQSAPQLIPRETFFSNPEKTNVLISPDGNFISYLSSVNDVLNIWIRAIGTKKADPITQITERSISEHFWMPNGKDLLFLYDQGGDENDQLFVVNRESLKIRELSPKGAKVRLLKLSDSFPNEALILCNDRDPSCFDVYKINMLTEDRHLIYKNDAQYVDFVADNNFVIQGAIQFDSQGGKELHIKEGDQFRCLEAYGIDDTRNLFFIGVSSDSKELYFIDSKGKDKKGVRKYSFLTNTTEDIFYDLDADCDLVSCNPNTNYPEIIFTYYLQQMPTPQSCKKWDVIKPRFEGQCIESISRGKKHPYWLISSSSDQAPPHYHLYDSQNESLELLFSSNEKIDQIETAKSKAYVITARDGLKLPIYLTLPSNAKTPAPMVLLVHGGPWSRDKFEYHPIRQFLVSRGYAVLNVNFRGSRNLGKSHLNAGNLQWSKKMHDDLIDGVNWAIDQQFADPAKIAILGGSYGGYAALVGATFTPKVFAAAIDIVGPSHIKTLLESIPPYWKSHLKEFEIRVGSLKNTKFLNEISPLTYIDRISRPLLILQGKNDPRVNYKESEQIVEAMQARSIPVTYGVFPDEGHGFKMEKNYLAAMAVIENFLRAHLGGHASPINDAISQSSLEIPVGKDWLKK